jgi:hypothetical protein
MENAPLLRPWRVPGKMAAEFLVCSLSWLIRRKFAQPPVMAAAATDSLIACKSPAFPGAGRKIWWS